jgi:outer membrane lipoprotein-sorting protein
MIIKENLVLRNKIKVELQKQNINLHYRQKMQLKALTRLDKDFRWEFNSPKGLIVISSYEKPFMIYVKDSISTEEGLLGSV